MKFSVFLTCFLCTIYASNAFAFSFGKKEDKVAVKPVDRPAVDHPVTIVNESGLNQFDIIKIEQSKSHKKAGISAKFHKIIDKSPEALVISSNAYNASGASSVFAVAIAEVSDSKRIKTKYDDALVTFKCGSKKCTAALDKIRRVSKAKIDRKSSSLNDEDRTVVREAMNKVFGL